MRHVAKSLAFPCFRRWRHYRKTHGQKWQIEDEEKASRWAANKEMLRLRDESQTGTAVTYGSASGTDTDAWAIVGTSLMRYRWFDTAVADRKR